MNPDYQISRLKRMVSKESETWNRFFKTLLKVPSRELDEQVIPLASEIAAGIDCRACANCCRELEAGLNSAEIQRLSSLLQLTEEAFASQHTATEKGTGIVFLKSPCVFLDDCSCSIYAAKPGSCSDFPGLERKGIKFRLRRIFQHLPLCPIIYHTMHTLHQRYYNGKDVHISE